MNQMTINENTRIVDTHSLVIGYVTWILGFMGAHRFYYGKPISGTIWFFTGGLLGIGWIVDLFLIPSMDRESDIKYWDGDVDYSIAWILLVFLGALGIHKFYMGKIVWGVAYLLTGGFFFIGVIYDFWTLNNQIDEINKEQRSPAI